MKDKDVEKNKDPENKFIEVYFPTTKGRNVKVSLKRIDFGRGNETKVAGFRIFRCTQEAFMDKFKVVAEDFFDTFINKYRLPGNVIFNISQTVVPKPSDENVSSISTLVNVDGESRSLSFFMVCFFNYFIEYRLLKMEDEFLNTSLFFSGNILSAEEWDEIVKVTYIEQKMKSIIEDLMTDSILKDRVTFFFKGKKLNSSEIKELDGVKEYTDFDENNKARILLSNNKIIDVIYFNNLRDIFNILYGKCWEDKLNKYLSTSNGLLSLKDLDILLVNSAEQHYKKENINLKKKKGMKFYINFPEELKENKYIVKNDIKFFNDSKDVIFDKKCFEDLFEDWGEYKPDNIDIIIEYHRHKVAREWIETLKGNEGIGNKKEEYKKLFNGGLWGIYHLDIIRGQNEASGFMMDLYLTDYFTSCVMLSIYNTEDKIKNVLAEYTKSPDKFFNNFHKFRPFINSFGVNAIIVLDNKDGKQISFGYRPASAYSRGNAQDGNKVHVTCNEALSLKDYIDNVPDIYNCVKRGISEEVGISIGDYSGNKIKFLDLFLTKYHFEVGITTYVEIKGLSYLDLLAAQERALDRVFDTKNLIPYPKFKIVDGVRKKTDVGLPDKLLKESPLPFELDSINEFVKENEDIMTKTCLLTLSSVSLKELGKIPETLRNYI